MKIVWNNLESLCFSLFQAGLATSSCPEQLLIALEPEAAAIYCRKLHRHQLVPAKSPALRQLQSPSVRPVSSPTGSVPEHYRGNTSQVTHVDAIPAHLNKSATVSRPYSTIDAASYRNFADESNDSVLTITEGIYVPDTIWVSSIYRLRTKSMLHVFLYLYMKLRIHVAFDDCRAVVEFIYPRYYAYTVYLFLPSCSVFHAWDA